MYPVSARFLAALAQSHQVLTKVELFRTDATVSQVSHTGGSVVVDRGQALGRTCTVTSAQVSLIPTTPAEELSVYGARLRISRGIRFSDGTFEMVPLGMFRLDDAGGDPALGPVTLTGKSLECIISDDRFLTPYRAVGTVVGAITALIARSITSPTIISLITDIPIGPRTWDVEGDPWSAVQEIAAAAGAECYTNADGAFVITALPDPATATPVWTVRAGEDGVYIKGDRSMSSAGVHNGVLARGENTETGSGPFQYLATDTVVGSPTRWGGPFGRRPDFYSSATIVSTGSAQAAAELKLRAGKAPNARGDFSSLPNPALERGDVLRVIHPDGLRELHQVQGFTVPLSPSGEFPISTIAAKGDS
ncbi:hypothetical protein EES45_22885 [Streptomyces sp. ADI97-07]|uniref:DUF5047 domain-containing protein n=1 Tax=Streptomyces sp. ADI97-07 TaxID=1522762 RepID=UPI000F54EBB7|nr:DUF5047 domain-containing protein [Streptomyces sp. ADI97-07]RPK76608.1 hypothetical protein EES45_22885 [Streptomyces sp. ADI97-07]